MLVSQVMFITLCLRSLHNNSGFGIAAVSLSRSVLTSVCLPVRQKTIVKFTTKYKLDPMLTQYCPLRPLLCI